MNFYRSLPILFILTILYGCKNDVPILAEKKEIPIVYCVLNPRDSVNYIRINRSSQDINNTHEFEYPGEIIVSMQEFGTNNYYAFEMTESFNKEIKAIPFDTKYIFKTNTLVLPKNRYALNIYFPEHMKSNNIDVNDYIEQDIQKVMQGKNFEDLSDTDKRTVIDQLQKEWTDPNNEVVKRMAQFKTKSPDILKPILES